MKNKAISEVGEKELIKILLDKRDKKLDITDKTIKHSYHDDAALIKNTTKYTVISTDMLIQHTHFPKQMSHYQMGKKVVTVNVSDILAMNATPNSILISMGLPPTMKLNEYNELTDGIIDKCNELNITLIGGDINQNTEIILCGTSTGKIDDKVKLQRNIEENNLIGVTGELGGPAAALDLLKENNNTNKHKNQKIIQTLLEPELPVTTSEILRKYPEITTSITDITDGLAVELGHLQNKNPEIGFEIYYNKLPYNKNIEEIAEKNDKKLTDYLLHFGEEFELLLTINKEEYEKHANELNIQIIGKTNNSKKITLIKDNKEKNIPIKGYEHLKDDTDETMHNMSK